MPVRKTRQFSGASPRNHDRSTGLRAIRCARAAFAATLIGTLALTPGGASAAADASSNPVHRHVTVTIGKTEDVDTPQSFADIMVGDPSVADVNPLTDRCLSIFGKKIGTTRVTVYGTDKKPVDIFDIQVSYDLTQLSSEIERVRGSGIKVSSINGRINLSGTAPDAVTLDKAVMIARQFAPDPINTVKVLQQQQVLLEVRFIEVDRSASRELGVQWNAFGRKATVNIGGSRRRPTGGSGVTLPVTATTAAGVLSGTAPFGFAVGQLLGNSQNSLSLAINALEQKGLARSLAEPNLVALSGDNASFLAGGSIPIPQASATGTPSFAYQDYGVSLNFTPTVLNDGVINLHISPLVSEIDPSVSVTIAGATVPGLTKRQASTTLELRDGQSFMLGGLLQNTSSTAQEPAAVGRQPAGARRSVPLQPVPEKRDRSGHRGDAAHRSPAAAERCRTHAVRQQPAGQRRRLLPDGKCRGQSAAGAARRRLAQPAVCRPRPRPAEEWRRLCVRQRLNRWAA